MGVEVNPILVHFGLEEIVPVNGILNCRKRNVERKERFRGIQLALFAVLLLEDVHRDNSCLVVECLLWVISFSREHLIHITWDSPRHFASIQPFLRPIGGAIRTFREKGLAGLLEYHITYTICNRNSVDERRKLLAIDRKRFVQEEAKKKVIVASLL